MIILTQITPRKTRPLEKSNLGHNMEKPSTVSEKLLRLNLQETRREIFYIFNQAII